MNRITYLLLLFLLLRSSPASAERIYSLVNYPDLQNGHTLSGTITTTDNAPDDSVLETDEILDWHWSIAGSNSVIRSLGPEAITNSQSIVISPTEITLPQFQAANLSLWSLPFLDSPPGTTTVRLRWMTSFLSSDPTTAFLSSYTAGFQHRDAVIPYWQSNLSPQNSSNWVIATAVPEPNTIILIILTLIAFVLCRNQTVFS